ncbi:MAG: glutaredoxin domain-containing protein [Syntrophobacteraceae bacterium]|jgi:glutaredoxin
MERLGETLKQEVNVYVLPTSPDTGKIKEFLARKGIDFNIYDIHSDVKAHKRMIEATRGACGAPVTEIGHRIVCGFDTERLEETISKELH